MNSDMAMLTSQHLCEAYGQDHISITIVTNCTGKYHQSIAVCIVTSKVTTPQDAHGRLVLQVYLGLSTLNIHR